LGSARRILQPTGRSFEVTFSLSLLLPSLYLYPDGTLNVYCHFVWKIARNVFDRRSYKESVQTGVASFYDLFTGILAREVFHTGTWKYKTVISSASSWRLMAWEWSSSKEKILVVINYRFFLVFLGHRCCGERKGYAARVYEKGKNLRHFDIKCSDTVGAGNITVSDVTSAHGDSVTLTELISVRSYSLLCVERHCRHDLPRVRSTRDRSVK
jgi:hypothetical protein